MCPRFRHDVGVAQRWMGPLRESRGSVGQGDKRRWGGRGWGHSLLTGRMNPGKSWRGFPQPGVGGCQSSAHRASGICLPGSVEIRDG